MKIASFGGQVLRQRCADKHYYTESTQTSEAVRRPGLLLLQYQSYAQTFLILNFYHDNLAEHRAKLSACGGEAVERAAVAGWECFSRDLISLVGSIMFLSLADTHNEGGGIRTCGATSLSSRMSVERYKAYQDYRTADISHKIPQSPRAHSYLAV